MRKKAHGGCLLMKRGPSDGLAHSHRRRYAGHRIPSPFPHLTASGNLVLVTIPVIPGTPQVLHGSYFQAFAMVGSRSSSKGQTTRKRGTQSSRAGGLSPPCRLSCRRGGHGETTVHPATHGDRRPHGVVPIRGRESSRYVQACPCSAPVEWGDARSSPFVLRGLFPCHVRANSGAAKAARPPHPRSTAGA
jgi:hypothetical protein